MATKTRTDLIKLLRDARYALYCDYLAAGGDAEAKTNRQLVSRGKLIDRIDRTLNAEGSTQTQRGERNEH